MKKLGILSCMNIMKTYRLFQIRRTFGIFCSYLHALDYYFVIMKSR